MCAITLWLPALFSSRTLPETLIAFEASEAKFLFSSVFCSLSTILFLEEGTVPQSMTTLTQIARRKLRLILKFTSWLEKLWLFFGLTGALFFALELSTRNLSCPSAFSFNHLLKSKSVGRCQLCLKVCIDQVSLRLGGKLLTAWFNRLTLFRSTLNDNDLETATRPDMAEEKLMTFSELCISSGGKVFSLSRCAPTMACGCPNFRCKVASA